MNIWGVWAIKRAHRKTDNPLIRKGIRTIMPTPITITSRAISTKDLEARRRQLAYRTRIGQKGRERNQEGSHEDLVKVSMVVNKDSHCSSSIEISHILLLLFAAKLIQLYFNIRI